MISIIWVILDCTIFSISSLPPRFAQPDHSVGSSAPAPAPQLEQSAQNLFDLICSHPLSISNSLISRSSRLLCPCSLESLTYLINLLCPVNLLPLQITSITTVAQVSYIARPMEYAWPCILSYFYALFLSITIKLGLDLLILFDWNLAKYKDLWNVSPSIFWLK